jgi:hypothetical protein
MSVTEASDLLSGEPLTLYKVIRNVVTHGCAGYGSLGETGKWRG